MVIKRDHPLMIRLCASGEPARLNYVRPPKEQDGVRVSSGFTPKVCLECFVRARFKMSEFDTNFGAVNSITWSNQQFIESSYELSTY